VLLIHFYTKTLHGGPIILHHARFTLWSLLLCDHSRSVSLMSVAFFAKCNMIITFYKTVICEIHFYMCAKQGCGLGLDISVSRRTNVSLVRLVSVSSREKLSTSRSRLGLGQLRLVPKTNFRPNCAGHSTQCERALDVVSLCCSYYCSSY